MYPFICEPSQSGEFNALKLSLSKGWLELTDKDVAQRNWQEMNYLTSFKDFSLERDEWDKRVNKVTRLFQLLNQNLHDIEFFKLKSFHFASDVALVVGKTTDETWIALSHTLYQETNIPQKIINRTQINKSSYTLTLDNKTPSLISEIDKIISELGTISLAGDFGGGYYYNYNHRIVSGVAKTKEKAIEKVLQESGTLEISKFHGFYPDTKNFGEYEGYEDEYNSSQHEQFNKINKFFAKNFSDVMMYRFSFWAQENIYIIGENQSGDRAGIYIKSDFVYNP